MRCELSHANATHKWNSARYAALSMWFLPTMKHKPYWNTNRQWWQWWCFWWLCLWLLLLWWMFNEVKGNDNSTIMIHVDFYPSMGLCTYIGSKGKKATVSLLSGWFVVRLESASVAWCVCHSIILACIELRDDKRTITKWIYILLSSQALSTLTFNWVHALSSR